MSRNRKISQYKNSGDSENLNTPGSSSAMNWYVDGFACRSDSNIEPHD